MIQTGGTSSDPLLPFQQQSGSRTSKYLLEFTDSVSDISGFSTYRQSAFCALLGFLAAAIVAIAIVIPLYFSGRLNRASGVFFVRIVDNSTSRGVPLVTLTTTDAMVRLTDSAGVAVFEEPSFIGQEIWISIDSRTQLLMSTYRSHFR